MELGSGWGNIGILKPKRDGEPMERIEFIEKLKIALSGEVNYNIINENVTYYEDYIALELQKGRSEAQILDELGDPRLLAKTIIETNKLSGSGVQEEEYTQGEEPSDFGRKAYRTPGWLVVIIVLLVIGVVFTTLTSFISFLFPILLPILIIVLVFRAIRKFLH